VSSQKSASRLLGPILTITATWLTKRGLTAAYQKKTGTNPPTASDQQASLGRIIAWAALSAVVLTAVDVLINRTLSSVDKTIDERELARGSVAVETDVTG
jgi:cytochrome c oxidase assembly factor CtaG